LLANGSFEDYLDSGWESCGNKNKIKFTHEASDGDVALKLNRNGCIYQATEIVPSTTVQLVCDAKIASKKSHWTGLGMSFYDQHWNYLSDATSAVISGNSYAAYEVTEHAPDTAAYVSVWFYSEDKALLDHCVLSAEATEAENLLYNGDFSITRNGDVRGNPVVQADGWRDACNGFNGLGAGREMVLSEGACVHQQLSNEAIQALEGNYFELTCDYNLTTDNYAGFATNLTDLRRETGHNENIVLTRTSTDQFLFGTATLSGKASDHLDPAPGVFVAIGKQGNDMLFVRNCSLTIVDGPLGK